MLPADTRVPESPQAVAAQACRLVEAAARAAIGARGVFRLVLAGGSTPQRAYQLLAATSQDWAAWSVFWGDERCLPAADPGRNSHMAQAAWLGRVPIPRRQIHPIAAELGATRAAADYARLIRDHLPFDLVLLGMGEDGHTASLFPAPATRYRITQPIDTARRGEQGEHEAVPRGREAHGPAARDGTDLVIAVHDAPKPPAERVSLGPRALRACRGQLVLVTGPAKAPALAAWRHGDDLPIARAVRADACLLVDESLRAAVGG